MRLALRGDWGAIVTSSTKRFIALAIADYRSPVATQRNAHAAVMETDLNTRECWSVVQPC